MSEQRPIVNENNTAEKAEETIIEQQDQSMEIPEQKDLSSQEVREMLSEGRERILDKIKEGEYPKREDLEPLTILGIDIDKPINDILVDIDKRNYEVIPDYEKEKHVAEIGVFTMASANHPDSNEDAVHFDADKGIIALADGVSTTGKSNFASLLAVDGVVEVLQKQKGAIKGALKKAAQGIRGLRDKIFAQGEKSDPTTTLTYGQIVFEKGKTSLQYGNLGDSRILHIQEGKKERITRDSSFLEALKDMGGITEEQLQTIDQVDNLEQLDQEEVVFSDKIFEQLKGMGLAVDEKESEQGGQYLKKRNSLKTVWSFRNVIMGAVDGDLWKNENKDLKSPYFEDKQKDLGPNDILVFYSDGVGDPLTDEEIQEEVLNYEELSSQELAEKIGKKARDRGEKRDHMRAKMDDISIVVAKVRDVEKIRTKNAIKEGNVLEILQTSNPETSEERIDEVLKGLEQQGMDTSELPSNNVTELAELLRLKAGLSKESVTPRIPDEYMNETDKVLAKLQFSDKKKWKQRAEELRTNGFDIKNQQARDEKLFQQFIWDQLKLRSNFRTEFMRVSAEEKVDGEAVQRLVEQMQPEKLENRKYIMQKTLELQNALQKAEFYTGEGMEKKPQDYMENEVKALKIFNELSKKDPIKKKSWFKGLFGR